MGFAQKNFSGVPIWRGRARSWQASHMTGSAPHKATNETEASTATPELVALVEAMARAAARADVEAEAHSGQDQPDRNPDHDE